MMAGGNLGLGWWFLDVDANWNLKTSVPGAADLRNPERQLTLRERDRLVALIRDLPRQQATYSFLGPYYVDVTVGFELTIGTGNRKRSYEINDTFKDYATHPEITPILRAMHFLRGLVLSKEGHNPPALGEGPAK